MQLEQTFKERINAYRSKTEKQDITVYIKKRSTKIYKDPVFIYLFHQKLSGKSTLILRDFLKSPSKLKSQTSTGTRHTAYPEKRPLWGGCRPGDFWGKLFGECPKVIGEFDIGNDNKLDIFAKKNGLSVTMGFDCEWFQGYRSVKSGVLEGTQWESTSDEHILKNRFVLSYQFSFVYEDVFYEFCFVPDFDFSVDPKKQRLRFDNLFYYMMRYVGIKAAYRKDCDVTLVGHFFGVDLSCFRDWSTIFDKNKNSKSKVILQSKQILFNTSPLRINGYAFRSKVKNKLNIKLRDTMALSSPKTPLADLGSSMGVPKMSTDKLDRLNHKDSNFYKMNMDVLYRDHRTFFIDYALLDARISLLWYCEFYKKFGDALTVSQASGGVVRKKVSKSIINDLSDVELSNLEKDCLHLLDPEETFTPVKFVYDYYIRGFVDEDFSAFNKYKHEYADIAAKCYYGGRNECYTHGVHRNTTYDIDIKQAYMISFLSMNDVDYTQKPYRFAKGHKFTLSDIKDPTNQGFGYVHFKFPEDVKFPSLAVRSSVKDGESPVFCLEGSTYASTPDIYCSLLQGAEIIVASENGFIMPVMSKTRYLSETIEDMMKQRVKDKEIHGKGSAFELLDKLLNNGFYGKTGQGVLGKNVKNFLTGDMERVGYCKVTDPCLASMVTAIVRMLLSMIMQAITKNGYEVYSATTDGLITNMPMNEHYKIDEYIYKHVPIFHDELKRVLDIDSLIEVKHKNDYFVNVRTRMNFGHTDDPNYDGVFARGGYKGGFDFSQMSLYDQQQKMMDLFYDREGAVSDVKNNINNLYDLKVSKCEDLEDVKLNSHGDIIDNYKRCSFEFDWKRKMIKLYDRGVIKGLFNYGYFTTKPYKDIEEYESYRRLAEIHRTHDHMIQSSRDLRLFLYQKEHLDMPLYKSSYDKDKRDRIKMRSFVACIKQNLFGVNALAWLNQEFSNDQELKDALEDVFNFNINLDSIFKKAKSEKKVDLFFARYIFLEFKSEYIKFKKS